MHESEIIVYLTATDPTIPNEVLETHMFEVLEIVESHADAADGAVVAVDFDKHQIELAFSLCHETQSQAQRTIADVLSLIETHTSVKHDASFASVRSQHQDEERSLTPC